MINILYIGKFGKMQYYHNTQWLTDEQVKAQTGCDTILNGVLFDGNGNLCADNKINGKWISEDVTGDFVGIAWSEGKFPVKCKASEATEYDNFLSAFSVAEDYRRGRTAIGFTKAGEYVVLCVQDGWQAMTIDDVDKTMNVACDYWSYLDGGGSSCCITPGGKINASTSRERLNQTYLLIWERKDNLQFTECYLKNSACYNANRWINPKGIMVHSTATPGAMAGRFIDLWDKPNANACVHAIVDDSGIYQTLPWTMRGWHGGGRSNDTHIGFEICEPTGITYNSNGSKITGYNPPSSYFKKAWNNAVELCAFLCKEFEFNPLTDILCHSEGYQKGIATNHADVMHWFPKEGKDMDMFRKAVKSKMNNDKDGYYNVGTEPSKWARESFDKAIRKGIFLGDGEGNYTPKNNITRESVAVILDRLGLLE